MSEAILDAKPDAGLVNLKEYLDKFTRVMKISVAANVEVKIYKGLCSRLNSGSKNK